MTGHPESLKNKYFPNHLLWHFTKFYAKKILLTFQQTDLVAAAATTN